MNLTTCPNKNDILNYVRGNSDESVEEHLVECEACQTVFDGFFTEQNKEYLDRFGEMSTSLLPHSQETLPDKIGQYRVVKQIGRGGMGVVYHAIHPELERAVAIKVVRDDRGMLSDRFDREKKVAGKLRHPNLLETTDAGTHFGRPYIVSELLEGSDLSRYVYEHGPLPWQQAVELLLQAAAGFAFMHRQGIVHRDVKPSNLFLTRNHVIKILDVGLARFLDGSGPQGSTVTGNVMGSFDYIAPEQIRDGKRADQRADMYSLGCTLYFLLSGKPPYFEKEYETDGGKLAAHLDGAKIPDIRTKVHGTPALLAEVLASMLEKKPEKRIASMEDLIGKLRPLTDNEFKSRNKRQRPLRPLLVIALSLTLFFSVVLLWQYTGRISPDNGEKTVSEADRPMEVPTSTEGSGFADAPTQTPDKTTEERWTTEVQRPSAELKPFPTGSFDSWHEDEDK